MEDEILPSDESEELELEEFPENPDDLEEEEEDEIDDDGMGPAGMEMFNHLTRFGILGL